MVKTCNTDNMLSLGQAACVVLDLKPTALNRAFAKKKLQGSGFGVTYIGRKHYDPIMLSKALIEKNPVKYKSYPATPPGSPPASAQPSRSRVPNFDLITNARASPRSAVGKISLPNSSTAPAPRNFLEALRQDKTIVIKIAKALFTKNCRNEDLCRIVYASDTYIYDVLENYIPISRMCSIDELSRALHRHEDHFHKFNESLHPNNLRILHMIREEHQIEIVKKVLQTSIPNWNQFF